MVRALLAGLLGLTLTLGAAAVDDKKAGDKGSGDKAGDKKAGDKTGGDKKEATITNIDRKNGTLTVKMKGKDGKETEKTFKLVETVRYFDSTGKVMAADVFKSGDYVLVVEADGQLREVHQKKKGDQDTGKPKKDKK